MATTISLINQKGGVGKTTLTLNLGAVFAASGSRTLLVDADPQGNLSSGLIGPAAVEQLDEEGTLAGLFSDRPPQADQVLLPTGFDGLYLLPSNELLGRYSMPVEMAGSRVATLRTMATHIADKFDVILIDNAPALNAISWASLLASQYVIIPTIPEDYSSQGLAQVRRTIEAAQLRNDQLGVLGIVLTLVQPRLNVHKAYDITLREAYGSQVFDTVIKADKMHKEAIMERQPVCQHKPRSAAATSYRQLAEEVVNRMEHMEPETQRRAA